MKVGIIVYSNTNNTYQVADLIYQNLINNNIDVVLERIINSTNYPKEQSIHLSHIPQVEKYDVVIFASPVEGMSLSKVMVKYFDSVGNLSNKKVLAFVTQFFPWPFLGGNNALKRMDQEIAMRGANVIKSAVVNWSNRKRNKMITNLVSDFTDYIKEL